MSLPSSSTLRRARDVLASACVELRLPIMQMILMIIAEGSDSNVGASAAVISSTLMTVIDDGCMASLWWDHFILQGDRVSAMLPVEADVIGILLDIPIGPTCTAKRRRHADDAGAWWAARP